MEVNHDSSVLPDQFHCFAVVVECESGAFEDGGNRHERRGLLIARYSIHMPQGCGLCW
jgi:hypothetical protein